MAGSVAASAARSMADASRVAVASPEHLVEMLGCRDGRIFRRLIRADAGWNTLDDGIAARIVEEGNRIAGLPFAVVVPDAMEVGLVKTVGPTCHEVSEIDHERSRQRRRLDPVALDR